MIEISDEIRRLQSICRRWSARCALLFTLLTAFLLFIDIDDTQSTLSPYLMLMGPSALLFVIAMLVLRKLSRVLILVLDGISIADAVFLGLFFIHALGGIAAKEWKERILYIVGSIVLGICTGCVLRTSYAFTDLAEALRERRPRGRGFEVVTIAHDTRKLP